jgi:hypothetical protein
VAALPITDEIGLISTALLLGVLIWQKRRAGAPA